MDDRGMVALARELRGRGLDVVRFDFFYRAKGSKAPDRLPQLRTCMTAVIERARAELHPTTLVIGGRSMGGRTASVLAAEGSACDGLLLFAYPLHPAGKPEKLRDAHLARIGVPVLCFNGTRDALCTRELMEAALPCAAASWQMHWIEGADHSLGTAKALEQIRELTRAWLA